MLNKLQYYWYMVKNSKGGKNSKRIARKHVTSMVQRVIRYVKEEGEMYGIVSKQFGSVVAASKFSVKSVTELHNVVNENGPTQPLTSPLPQSDCT